MFKGKNILITGAAGMIAQELIPLLRQEHVNILEVDIKYGHDLTDYRLCKDACRGIDYVFHLAGLKGSPKRNKEKPYTFIYPMIQFDSNMIRASHEQGIERFLYTSSIAVLSPERDKFPAWAKLTGETQILAYRQEFPEGMKCTIVRPGNVYGKYDDFSSENLMVVSDLIRKAFQGEIEVWGDGSEVRQFIDARDVARGMILAMANMPNQPINLTSKTSNSIKQVAEIINKYTGSPIRYISTEMRGERKREMPFNGEIIGWEPGIKIEEGIKSVIAWKGG